MRTATKVIVTVGLVLALLALALWATTPRGWAAERGKITRWDHRVVSYNQQRLPMVRGKCTHKSRAVEKTRGGNRLVREIISFYSSVTWYWGRGVVCGKPQVDVWPDKARVFWEWQGITARTGPDSFWLGSPPLEHVQMGRWVKYTRGFEWLQQVVTPNIKWVVNGGGGCALYKSGHPEHERC